MKILSLVPSVSITHSYHFFTWSMLSWGYSSIVSLLIMSEVTSSIPSTKWNLPQEKIRWYHVIYRLVLPQLGLFRPVILHPHPGCCHKSAVYLLTRLSRKELVLVLTGQELRHAPICNPTAPWVQQSQESSCITLLLLHLVPPATNSAGLTITHTF